MLNEKIFKTIEYYLYNYNQLDSMIHEIESSLLLPKNYSYDQWLQSKQKNACTLENQVIRIIGKQKEKQADKMERHYNDGISGI